MTGRRRPPAPPPPPTTCGHPDEHPQWALLVDGGRRLVRVCVDCAGLAAQTRPLPCIGCGAFDPRPAHPGEFNAPSGYYGGGFHEGDWCPWCPECLEPLPTICMRCMGALGQDHVHGQPPRLVNGAGEKLALRLAWSGAVKGTPWYYPAHGIELRHMLGQRDWHPDHGSCALPAAQSLWPSVEAAEAAMMPTLARLGAYYRAEQAKPVQMNLFAEPAA